MKAATQIITARVSELEISIHAAREGGDGFDSDGTPLVVISIHAAREGGDTFITVARGSSLISIHAAREGGDHISMLS